MIMQNDSYMMSHVRMYNLKMDKVLKDVKSIQKEKYSWAFNFFQSKSINLILSHRKVQHAIHYRDMEFFDDEVEYLKRFYHQGQSHVRVHKLINYYQNNMTPPQPNLLPVDSYPLLESRRRKILKLQIMKEKSLARKKQPHDKPDSTITNHCLPELEHSNFSDVDTSKDSNSFLSYDSSVHDLFDDDQLQAEPKPKEQNDQVLSVRCMKESYLIIDFRKVVKLNESERKVREVKEEEKSRVVVGKASKEKKEKRGQSFMEYYNSISKKNTSNILQKYIKIKR